VPRFLFWDPRSHEPCHARDPSPKTHLPVNPSPSSNSVQPSHFQPDKKSLDRADYFPEAATLSLCSENNNADASGGPGWRTLGCPLFWVKARPVSSADSASPLIPLNSWLGRLYPLTYLFSTVYGNTSRANQLEIKTLPGKGRGGSSKRNKFAHGTPAHQDQRAPSRVPNHSIYT
jgi:hypothetical protein